MLTSCRAGGWIVEFMIRTLSLLTPEYSLIVCSGIRHAANFASGMSATGFWLGMTIGRLVLGFVSSWMKGSSVLGQQLTCSSRSRPRLAKSSPSSSVTSIDVQNVVLTTSQIYLPIAMALELLFWLVPQFYVSAVAVAFQGFFLGPLFPAAVVACTKLLPKHLHVSSIGFAAAFGGSGGALFPYAVGAIAQAKGVQVLQPIVLALMAVIWLLWLGLPRMNKKRE